MSPLQVTTHVKMLCSLPAMREARGQVYLTIQTTRDKRHNLWNSIQVLGHGRMKGHAPQDGNKPCDGLTGP